MKKLTEFLEKTAVALLYPIGVTTGLVVCLIATVIIPNENYEPTEEEYF